MSPSRSKVALLSTLNPRHFVLSGMTAGASTAVPTASVELSVFPEGVLSSPVAPPAVKVISCIFEHGSTQWVTGREQGVKNAMEKSGTDLIPTYFSPDAPRYTRIRPPRDIVKLEDRLRLLLQPPLETLLAARALRFAFPPFGYQLDGIAFLYPRHEAVLADEM